MSAVTSSEESQQQRLPTPRRQPSPQQVVPTWKILAGGPLASVLFSAAALVAAFLTPWTGRMLAVSAGLAVWSVLIGVGAVQRQRRLELVECLVTQLGPVTGPTKVTVRRWSWKREPVPTRLRLTYSAGAQASHPSFESTVCQVLGDVVGADYRVARHRSRLHRLEVRLHVPDGQLDPVDDRSFEQIQAEKTLTRMLGPTASITAVELDPDTGSLISLVARHDIGVKVAAPGYQRKVENTFNRLIPGRWRAVWDLPGDTVRMELRPSFPDLVRLDPVRPVHPDALQSYEAMFVPVGVDEDGHVVGWSPKTDPMFVIVGKTGQGKTVTARSMIMTVAAHGWAIWIVDGKGIEFLGLRDWPNVQMVANDVLEQVAVIYRAHELMEHRYRMVREGKARITDFEPLLLFIDEWADFRANLMDYWTLNKPKGAPAKPPVLSMLGSLLRKGRTSRLHVGLGTQRPDAEYFGGDMRDNLGMRISMGRLSVQGAQMMWDSSSVGVALPRGKRGRGTAVNAEGRPVEVQTFYAADPFTNPAGQDADQLGWLRQVDAVHPRLLIEPPDDPELDYYSYVHASWVLAADRPDLDPLVSDRARVNLRAVASPMAKLLPSAEASDEGNAADDELRAEDTPARRMLRLVDEGETQTASAGRLTSPARDDDDDIAEVFEGYGDPEDLALDEIGPGYLVLEDENDHWVVVEDVGEDLTDETQLAISWRDDQDEDGVISLGRDERITARAPVDEDLSGAGDFDELGEWQ